ncbi:MAG TPA: mannose-6-phosphate isomerase, partial [Bacteroidales bacterium]
MSNYNKTPYFPIDGNVFAGWDHILDELNSKIRNSPSNRFVLVVECYQGVHHDELLHGFSLLNAEVFIQSEDAFYSEDKIREMTYPDVTDDAIFGFMSRLTYLDFLDAEKVEILRQKMKDSSGLIIVYGHAASLIAEEYDCLVYADMARWEIQLRQRRQELNNLGLKNSEETPAIQYKRGYFVDWRVCDRLKQKLFDKADYWLDTNKKDEPKMIAGRTLLDGLTALSKSPFRMVPYFDPGPWGGQWMKEVCGLDQSQSNFAWSFDGVPEENSLLLKVEDTLFEIPAINLVFYKSKELLGEPVESRFGKEFPIRFDFLDTMDGGNLSLQVHPVTQYIRETFGMSYTQDE